MIIIFVSLFHYTAASEFDIFFGLKPRVVFAITLSNSINIAGKISVTQNILMTAPLARSLQIDEIRSTSE